MELYRYLKEKTINGVNISTFIKSNANNEIVTLKIKHTLCDINDNYEQEIEIPFELIDEIASQIVDIKNDPHNKNN